MKIHVLQILRGMAALMVLFYHIAAHRSAPLDEGTFAYRLFIIGGGFGVNLFFLISGFIMFHVTGPQTTPRRFIGRRIVRIVPLYWLLLLFGRGFKGLSDPATYRSMLFLPLSTQKPPSFGFAAWVVGWTLNYEMFFYLIFCVSLFFKRFRYMALFGIFALLHLAFIHFAATEGGGGWLRSIRIRRRQVSPALI